MIKFKRAVENKDAIQRQAVPVYIETRRDISETIRKFGKMEDMMSNAVIQVDGAWVTSPNPRLLKLLPLLDSFRVMGMCPVRRCCVQRSRYLLLPTLASLTSLSTLVMLLLISARIAGRRGSDNIPQLDGESAGYGGLLVITSSQNNLLSTVN